MRAAPTTPDEQRAMEAAYDSTDPFAIARYERPGCKYIRFVDKRTRNNFGFSFVVAVPPESPRFETLLDDQTSTLIDDTRDAPTVPASPEPAA